MRTKPTKQTKLTKRQREARALARILKAIKREEQRIARLKAELARMDDRPFIVVAFEVEAREYARMRREGR